MEPPYSTGTRDDIGVVETEFGRIGVIICADTFVDEFAQKVASLKPDLMLVPYGWAAKVEEWPAHEKDLERLVSSRAKLWQCPTIGTDLVGEMTHGPWKARTYGGASVVADANGNVVEVLRDRDTEVRIVELATYRRSKFETRKSKFENRRLSADHPRPCVITSSKPRRFRVIILWPSQSRHYKPGVR
jgi:N-carbamoylputrescine amidase